MREISRKLGRSPSTISRELSRNRNGDHYVAIYAQARAGERVIKARHRHPLKNKSVYKYVIKKLRSGWSPEQISGRLREVEHPREPHWQISHETIYAWIYGQPKNEFGKYWFEYLRRKQKKRKKQKGRTVHRSHIPDRVSISQRPEEINNRTEFGHWEGDSVEGPRNTRPGLHTEVERVSRKVKGVKVAAITSEESLKAQTIIFADEPPVARKSTTVDNGRETHLHYKLRSQFNMMTYHAHPYCSWERGTNEHGNWHLRYYFPKGTDFSTVTEAELQAVINEINNRPRKIHHFLTANEVYYQLLKKERGCDDRK